MRRDLLLLGEILDAAERLVKLVEGRTVDDIAEDELRRDALFWNFTVLGEASGQLSDELRAAHGGVEWQRPVKLRNRIVHGYWSIDLEFLLSTARDAACVRAGGSPGARCIAPASPDAATRAEPIWIGPEWPGEPTRWCERDRTSHDHRAGVGHAGRGMDEDP